MPTFRLPVHIHTRSANSKWLMELANNNPVWIHTSDAARIGAETGDLVKVITRIGHFVDRAWVTEAIRPGVVERWASAKVAREELAPGVFRMRRTEAVNPAGAGDRDGQRATWTEGGVHENLAFPVQPDPVSGMHCWHQAVRVVRAESDDRYGDIVVDTDKSQRAYENWLAKCRPADRHSPDGTRRPAWLIRPVKPTPKAYKLPEK